MNKLLIICLLLFAAMANAQDNKMNAFIDGLMKKMTLEEKIGQLNLPGAGDITTGQASNSDIAKKIEKGNYTKQSFATLAEAISQAEFVLNNEAATEAEITEAIKLIDEALKDLVEKTPSKEENPNQSSNNDSLGNGTNDNGKNGQNDKLHSNDNNNGLNSSPVDVGTGDTLELDQNKNEDNLPKTATSYYTLIFVGVLLLMVASALLMIERRKTRN